MLSKDVLKEPTKRFGSGLALKIVKKTRRLEPIKPESVSTVVMTTTATQLIVLTAVCMELYYRWLHLLLRCICEVKTLLLEEKVHASYMSEQEDLSVEFQAFKW